MKRLCLLLALGSAHASAHDPQPSTPPVLRIGGEALRQAAPAATGTLPMKAGRTLRLDVQEGTWLSPDLSPDGKRIVFELLGDLYLLEVGGGEARRITNGLPFDSQPVFSPDGRRIAFVSDRGGGENIWIARADGAEPRQLTRYTDVVLTSPAWSADGRSLTVSRFRPDLDSFELLRVDGESRAETMLVPVKADDKQPRTGWTSTLGAVPSADGRFLYFASRQGNPPGDAPAEWAIVRRELATGRDETIISAPRSFRPDLILGTAFRPILSPDGRSLVYGTRHRGRTGLRLLDLETRADRWLRLPVQADETWAEPWRDLLPRHVFTPDSRGLIANVGGKIARIDVATGALRDIPFRVRADVGIGASTRQRIREPLGPVAVRLIQDPVPSPDGRRLAFSALGAVYVMPLRAGATPVRLTEGFQPSWSADGRSLTFVRWKAATAGQVWTIGADGSAARQVSTVPAFYTHPVFTPTGETIVAVRSDNRVRTQAYMEFGSLRAGELVATPAAGGPARPLAAGYLGGTPHFGPGRDEVLALFDDGVNAVKLDGSGRRRIAAVSGPGWYFAEGRAPADDIRVSPDGQHALVQLAQQLHLVNLPADGRPVTIDLADPGVRKLTAVGADFFGWAEGGRTIDWAVGSTFYQRELADVGRPAFEAAADPHKIDLTLPRATATGTLVLRGATVVTMRGDEAIEDADVVIRDGRIAAVGPRGRQPIPAGASVRQVAGKWIVPGFIDTHVHLADIRRGVLDLDPWGVRANLAYGVTTVFDPSTLSIDMLAYQDAVDAGLTIGSRIRSTGPAIFSFNEFTSYPQVEAVLRRYRDHYGLRNIKMYRSGNRRVRQWIAIAARRLGLQPTSESALAMKLAITQILDGYATIEHALTGVPLRADMLVLMAGSGVGYNTTLMIKNGGPEGQDWFIARGGIGADAKLARFTPPHILDMKTRTRTWRQLSEYRFPAAAADAARVQRAGGLVGMGSHGEMPGIGFHWEMQAHVIGGMSPAEVLRAATIGSARVIGRDADLGSIEPGKIADLVILDRDPRADISAATAISAVMLEGRLRDGNSLAELWPVARPLPRHWTCDDRPPGDPDPCR